MTWEIYRRDNQTLARLGVVPFVQVQAGLRWCAPSRAVIDTASRDAADVELGSGIIVARDGQTVLSGVVAELVRTVEGDEDRTEIVVVDELGRIAARQVYPDPSASADGVQGARDIRTGPAGDVILQYIDLNAGPGALPDRRIDGLTVATGTGQGATVTGRGRWNPLVQFCRTIADRGGVGFRAVQELGVAASITVDVVVPVDRWEARFDVDGLAGSGALAGWQSRKVLPSVTVAIAGGRGDLDARLVRVGEDAVAEWGRWETWLDRNNAGEDGDLTSQQNELDDEIDDALREGAVQADLDLSLGDSPALRWRTHYDLGDRVRVLLDGVWEWRQVRGIDVTVSSDGERVAPLLGDAARTGSIRFLDRLDALEQQVDERGRG